MTIRELSAVLTTKYPGAQWALYGTSYSDLVWLDPVVPKPSAADLGL